VPPLLQQLYRVPVIFPQIDVALQTARCQTLGPSQSQSYITTNSQSACPSWCPAPIWSSFASGRCCDRPTRSRFSVVFLGPRANAELVPKFHVSLYASHAALAVVTLNISPYTSVTLTFDRGMWVGWGGGLALRVGGVSDETVVCGCGSGATLTSAWLHCKLQTRPLVGEGPPHEEERKWLSTKEN
jgi:hypothetical protein